MGTTRPVWPALAALLLAGWPATAQERPEGTEPLWELGIGGFGLSAPDYPASAERQVNGLVLPYAIFRGEVIRVDDEDGARVVPVDTPLFELSLSAGAAFGANSEARGVRAGLPDLDPLLELGPELVFRGPVFGRPGARGRVDFALQTRLVGSVDVDNASVAYRGVVVEPQVSVSWPDALGDGTQFSASLGPVFATEALHDYFYEVAPDFARADRPAFDARGGYLGTDLIVALSYDLGARLTAFGGFAASFHAGAANSDSPLFEEEVTGSAFVGLAVILRESVRRVPRRF